MKLTSYLFEGTLNRVADLSIIFRLKAESNTSS